MPEYERLRPRDAHERAFRLLLSLYPREFRDEFGDAMMEFFRDRLTDARSSHGALGVIKTWAAALLDVLRHAVPAHFDTVRRAAGRILSPSPRAVVTARRKDWMWSSILQDIRYAARGMLRSPGFSATIIVTLALGIGANAAIFSVVNGVLLAPLPYAAPDRIAEIELQQPYGVLSEPEFADIRRDSKNVQSIAAYTFGSGNLTGGDAEPERIRSARVSDGFFRVLGVPPFIGRTFTPEEERPNGPPVVLLTYGLWQRRFGSDPAVVGRGIQIDGTSRIVVGVMPASFRFPPEGSSRAAAGAPGGVGLWTPLRLNYDNPWTRNNHYLNAIARLAPGATIEQTERELNDLVRRWMTQYPETYSPDKPLLVSTLSLSESLLGSARPFLLSLAGAVGFVLLIACVNVANLLLLRAESRRKDLAIRTALGASRTRIVRQGLTENLLYSVAGGALGMVVAYWSMRALVGVAPADVPRLEQVQLDWPVFVFTMVVALVTGLGFGVVPALLGARDDTPETLREGGKTSTAAARGSGRTRRRLVAAEIALAVMTLSGAGLMVRSLYKLQAVDLGFQPSGLVAMTVNPPVAPAGISEEEVSRRTVALYEDVLARVRALPGVESAAAAQEIPVADGLSGWSILIDGATTTSVSQAPVAAPAVVTPDYFRVMQIQVSHGRVFTESDGSDGSLVVVVNETMAKRLWPGRDPIGGTVRMMGGNSPPATVIGVVKDVRAGGFSSEAEPTMYFPHSQAGRSAYFTPRAMNLVVRTRGEPSMLIAPVRNIVRQVEPNAPLSRESTLDRLIASTMGARRFTTGLVVVFAALALLLAGLGIYGVISAAVSQRTYEIGVRMALGARRMDVVKMVLREGLRTAAGGTVFGLAGALASTLLLRPIFFDVQSWDPLSLGGAVVLLFLVVLAASGMPAFRATTVDPNRALRGE